MGLAVNDVYQGDCVEKLKSVKPGSVDLVFADPPFNIGYKYDTYHDSRPAEEFVGWCREWMTGVERALKPDGTFWLAIGDEFAAELKVAAQELGFKCRSWVIWYYTFGVNCTRAFSRSHTHLLHFVKDPKQFTFNAEHPQVRVPSARELVYADDRANPKGRLPDNTWVLRPQDGPSDGFSPDHDTWYFSRVAGTFKEREGFHGCQMPEQLLARIIRVSSNPAELVLDPFAGSGTTLAVAKKLGRQWMGFELSTEYATRIKSRLKAIEPGDELDGPADPVASSPKTSKGRRLKRKKTDDKKEEYEKALIDVFQDSHEGASVDQLLCDAQLNASFVKACKSSGLGGDAAALNRTLMNIRKQGRLPRLKERAKRSVTFRQMDSYSFASEIAMEYVCREFDRTLDEVLCDPFRAQQFDLVAEKFSPGFTSFQYRWAAFAIRKRAKQASRAAVEFAELAQSPLPRSISAKDFDPADVDGAGVYLIAKGNQRRPIYIGETLDLSARLATVLNTEAWTSLAPFSIRVIPESKHPYGLQSALVQRLKPTLNSRELVPKQKAEVTVPRTKRAAAR
ncbi:MAG: DNA methyltransferase [Pirellulaceae bacterium]|nr:DNA methyltransferase [Pirellulaceae bacterium]MDP7018512.1 DNA methyltransferase [Pirellulaceae bacterium]